MLFPSSSLLLLLLPFLTLDVQGQSTAAPVIRNVSLLTDSPAYSSLVNANVTVRSVLQKINDAHPRRGREEKFYFGSTVADPSLYPQMAEWTDEKYRETFNMAVAENNCKMFSTQPGPGEFNLTACLQTRDYAFDRGLAYRGHNLIWHNQRPNWMVNGNYTAQELNETIIPESVYGVLHGMGPDVFSWDVVNEPWTDNHYPGIGEAYCTVNATRWPNYAFDGMANSTILFNDSNWIDTAFIAADKARNDLGAPWIGLYLNDYNVGGGAKAQCALKTIRRLKNAGVPIDGLGVQSHYSAQAGVYPSKADQHWNFDQLKSLGLKGAITEIDVWLKDNSTESYRYQAAIFGDMLDACLYSSNCNEYVIWNARDDQSWLEDFPDRGVASGTLFDKNGEPKLAYYEVLARLQNFAHGGDEPCATSDGVEECVLEEKQL